MSYLVLCKTLAGQILDWKELHNEPCDNSAVMSGFDFGTRVDDTDVIELYYKGVGAAVLICSIRL